MTYIPPLRPFQSPQPTGKRCYPGRHHTQHHTQHDCTPVQDCSNGNARKTTLSTRKTKASFTNQSNRFENDAVLKSRHFGGTSSSCQQAGELRTHIDGRYGQSERIALPLRSKAGKELVQDSSADHKISRIVFQPRIREKGPRIATRSNDSGLPKGNLQKISSIKTKTSSEPKSTHESRLMPKPDGSYLLRLPGELRNMINELVVVENGPIELDRQPPPISQTCSFIRKESLGIYYGKNRFRFTLQDFERGKLMSFFDSSKHSNLVRLDIWHKLTADTPTLKANLWDWVEKGYHYEAPLLGFGHRFVAGEFDVKVHAHRISMLFGVLQDCQLYHIDWNIGKVILGKVIAGLGVCGEHEADRH